MFAHNFRVRSWSHIKTINFYVKSDRGLRSMVHLVLFALILVGVNCLVYWRHLLWLASEGRGYVSVAFLTLFLFSVLRPYFVMRARRFFIFLIQAYITSYFLVIFYVVWSFVRHVPRTLFRKMGNFDAISLDVSYVSLILIAFGFCLLVGFCVDEGRFGLIRQVATGLLVVVGILLPDLLGSYRQLNAIVAQCGTILTCEGGNAYFALMVTEAAISSSAAFALLYVSCSATVSNYVRRYLKVIGEVERNSVDWSDENSEGRYEAIKLVSSRSFDGAESGVGRVAISVSAGEESIGASASVDGYSCSDSAAAPRRLMSAIVSGLVAGACFSVVSRLFSRR